MVPGADPLSLEVRASHRWLWTSTLTVILPAMTLAEALETTRIDSIAGRTGDRTAVVSTRPFRAPHHPISDVGRMGGGQVLLPGGVSLVYHGLFA